MSKAEEANRRQKERWLQTCTHFNGIQNKCCEAGLRYEDFQGKDSEFALPCLPHGEYDKRAVKPCEKMVVRTLAEWDDHEAKIKASMDRMRKVMPVVAEWRKKPPRGKQGVIDCPACGGKLHLSQSSYNGHVWGQCETKGCVSWME